MTLGSQTCAGKASLARRLGINIVRLTVLFATAPKLVLKRASAAVGSNQTCKMQLSPPLIEDF